MAKILFVDDSRDTADLLATFFKLLGHETAVAYDGDRAVDLSADFAPDIAFIDLRMPMMDGFETAREFRVRRGANTILIALTGQDRESVRIEANLAGFDGFFEKPAKASDLVAIVDALPH